MGTVIKDGVAVTHLRASTTGGADIVVRAGGGLHSTIQGEDTTAEGECSHAEGYNSETGGTAEANEKTAGTLETSGAYAHAEGNSTIAKGISSHSEGTKTFAAGVSSHAEGDTTQAIGTASHSEGFDTVAEGECSHAEGDFSEAYGNASHAEGNDTVADGDNSHAEGHSTSAAGENSHAEGYLTYALGVNSHAEGRSRAKVSDTVATGSDASILEAWDAATNKFSLAKGHSSHLEGYNNLTLGNYSHAEGAGTNAIGAQSHVEGNFTKALNDYEHAEGSFNKSNSGGSPSTNTRHSVGIGTSDTARKNAFEVMRNGDAYLIGLGNYDGTNPADADTIQTSLAGKQDKTPIAPYIPSGGMLPDVFYDLGEISADPDVSIAAVPADGKDHEWMLAFSIGATAPASVTFPADVVFPDTPSWEENKHYEISMKWDATDSKYFAVVQSWDRPSNS